MRITERVMPNTEEDASETAPEEAEGVLDDTRLACASPVQLLFEACKSTFTQTDGHFSAEGLQLVRSLLDNIKPIDVGLNDSMEVQNHHSAGFLKRTNVKKGKVYPPVSYIQIYDCANFTIGIFCLPPSSVIPLHNHPGMTVLSKLLYGSMHVKAYDWADQTSSSLSNSSNPRLAKMVINRTMSAPCDSTVLYPTSGGNMHAFTAITQCAVLDVLAPPYNNDAGRHCTYYKSSPCASAGPLSKNKKKLARQDYAWLDEVNQPLTFVVDPAPYKGPEVIP